jgi:hypothetical protein
MDQALINVAVVMGAVAILFSGIQITDYFARGSYKWPIWGVIAFYWLLYIAGIVLTYTNPASCTDGVCQVGKIGGATLIVFGYSAVAFYLLTVYSFTSLRHKMKKLNFSDKFTEKIRDQHSNAVIVFFFTTWVAAGFVYLIHHRASLVVRAAKKDKTISQAELEKRLTEVFGRKVDWHKKKKTK